MAWEQLAIQGGILALSYAYHRWSAKDPPKPVPARVLTIPRNDEGAPYPLIFGRCRVNAPIVAWTGSVQALDVAENVLEGIAGGAPFIYATNMLLILGIPFERGVNNIHTIYAGDLQLLTGGGSDPLSDLVGDGNHESLVAAVSSTFTENQHAATGGFIEFLNGRPDQELVDSGGTSTTIAADLMIAAGVPATAIPGFRNQMLAALYGVGGPGARSWLIGSSPNLQSYSIEASSYPGVARRLLPAGNSIGLEANPADVIYDLLTALFGKLGIGTSRIDRDSFAAAAVTLFAEEHGFSRCFEDIQDAADSIGEILEQIDAVLYEDPSDGKFKIKLVRGDYVPSECPQLTVSDADVLEYELQGLTTPITSVRVIYSDRDRAYRDNSETSQSLAAAAASAQSNEASLHYRGVCTSELANQLAARELGYRSIPVAKCRVKANRGMRNVVPGDVVALTWPELGISDQLFRVAHVDRGLLGEEPVVLSLLSDFFFQFRGELFSLDLPAHRG